MAHIQCALTFFFTRTTVAFGAVAEWWKSVCQLYRRVNHMVLVYRASHAEFMETYVVPNKRRIQVHCRRLQALALVVGAVWAAVIWFTIDEEARPTSPFVPIVNASVKSRELRCGEMSSGYLDNSMSLDVLRNVSVSTMLRYPDLNCVCAAMFGAWVKYTVMRDGPDLVELFNMEMVQDQASEKVYSLESQVALFPHQEEPVEVLRNAQQKVLYSYPAGVACKKGTLTAHNHTAFCLQSCGDLMNGVSIYMRSKFDSKEAHD